MSAYLIGGRRVEPHEPGFHEALAWAYRSRHRPLCLCKRPGAEMYVAHVGTELILKRMPLTGNLHASFCPAGWFQLAAHDCRERPTVDSSSIPPDASSIRLAFAMSRSSRSSKCASVTHGESQESGSVRLSLGELLYYLWDRAGLTHWHPGFAGKRNWFIVRKRLLDVAQRTYVGNWPLSDRLFIPEVFRVDDEAEIRARNNELWRQCHTKGSRTVNFSLVVGEIKEVTWSSAGIARVRLKQIPDRTLDLCNVHSDHPRDYPSDQIRLMLIATTASLGERVQVVDMSLMQVTRDWLPTSESA